MKVPFGDLKRCYDAHRGRYDEAVARVLRSGWFVLGKELEAFESEFADYCGAPFCVGCGSGTEAIHLALRAHGIASGDRVVTVPNTCVPTVTGIFLSGARIGLCDVRESDALMDPASLGAVLAQRPAKAVLPVHLYGQPVDLDALAETADAHGAVLIEDAAQAHGATYKGKRIGAHGFTTCWSFYPSKNLGAFGDAGAVTTHSGEIAARLRMLRNYGQQQRYHHAINGTNSRLDEMQAALLQAKLPLLDEWNARRRAISARYRAEIRNPHLACIERPGDRSSCEHLFVMRSGTRDTAMRQLADAGVQCLIHYPVPVHLQEAFADLGHRRGAFPHAEALCDSVLSLPIYPELTDAEVGAVIGAANDVVHG